MRGFAWGAIAAAVWAPAWAQPPAGTVEVTADECKMFVAQAEARGASRVRWSGQCVDGHADGHGHVRVYAGGRIRLAAERTYKAGKLTAPADTYFVRDNRVFRIRAGDNLQIAASELPAWALELSLLVDDRPAPRPKPAPAPAAPKPAPVAAPKAAPEPPSPPPPPPAPPAAPAPAAAPQPGYGFAEHSGSTGAPLRGVVKFTLATQAGTQLGIATFVAGRGEVEIRQNAEALAALYQANSPFNGVSVGALEVGPICNGPGYVMEARITYPGTRGYGWYAGCLGRDVEQAARSMQQIEDQLHRDQNASPSSFWAYQYLIVGYVDYGGFRNRAEYPKAAQPGIMAPGRVMVLPSAQTWAECNSLVNQDPKLKDKAACLREAVGKLKTTLGLR
jgi:hypothetical protein